MQAALETELFIDSFAGGGGASDGIEIAIRPSGRHVDIAINHDPAAIAMHRANHPKTKHYCESVWEVDPREATQGKPVALAWFSPDCKHHSKARGGKPREKNIRGLAWVVIRWAATVKPRVIILENVEEFQDWGPLTKDNRIDPKQKGRTFKTFVNALRYQGYKVEWRELRACDYGAPTTRNRFFLIARSDGLPIVWPEATHGPGKLPYITAAECIDFSLPTPSIFSTAREIKAKYGVKAVRPLAPNTMKRIAQGIDKFFLKNPEPYIIQVNHGVAPTLIQYHDSKEARGQTVNKPIMTIDASPRYALAATFLKKYYGQSIGQIMEEPLHTVTSKARSGLCIAHIVKFKGDNKGQSPDTPLQTATAGGGQFGLVKTYLEKINDTLDLGHWPEIRKMLNTYCHYEIGEDEVLLVEIDGQRYFIADIGLRMLIPRELFTGNGFRLDYIIDRDDKGKPYSKTAQVARAGNAVCPPLATVLTRVNLPEYCGEVRVQAITVG